MVQYVTHWKWSLVYVTRTYTHTLERSFLFPLLLSVSRRRKSRSTDALQRWSEGTILSCRKTLSNRSNSGDTFGQQSGIVDVKTMSAGLALLWDVRSKEQYQKVKLHALVCWFWSEDPSHWEEMISNSLSTTCDYYAILSLSYPTYWGSLCYPTWTGHYCSAHCPLLRDNNTIAFAHRSGY